MRIQHNQAGLSTYRQQQMQGKFVSKSMEKLSSGIHVNRAADDAAGLTISEKMRGQIRGLQQVQRNIQHGISLVQTADAGLGEIANPNLVRLRKLAIQAATDTLTSMERAAIQTEVDQIIASINDVATRTTYNERQLLNIADTDLTVEPGGMEKIVTVPRGGNVEAGYVEIPNPPDPNTFEIEAFFGTISGAEWPDLNIIAPNGQKIGYNGEYLTGSGEQKIESESGRFEAADEAWYNGFSATDEKMIFTNPIPGKWTIEIRHDGGSSDSTFKVKSNYIIEGGQDLTGGGEHSIVGEKNLKLQVGPNTGQQMEIELTDVTAVALGLENLSMGTREEANTSLASIDDAIHRIASERARFGSYDNRLAHSYQNASNYLENISQAESLLRDTDIAAEASKLQAKQVILQAAQAMGAQANQQMQGILELLG